MLTAADVMTTEVVKVAPDTPVREIAKLLYTRRISGVPVVDAADRVLGIVSEGDLIGHADVVGEQRRSWWLTFFSDGAASARDYAKAHATTAEEVMTTHVFTVAETASLAEIAKTLERHRIKRVPVVRDGRLVGIITRSNLLQALATADVSQPKALDDQAILDRLNAELEAQPWANLRTKSIVVEKGIVHLFGLVHTEDERRALRVAAENVPGVIGIDDHLTVSSIERFGV
jgi:CBS-domain-containing membrane protein